MAPETTRRLTALGVIAAAAATAATLLAGTDVASTAPAAAARPARPAHPARHVIAVVPARAQLASAHPLVKACPVPAALRPAFETAARDTDLPLALLYSVAKIESNLDQDVTSGAGARGLLQLMPTTGAMLALDINEPSANVLAGARYLRQLLDRFESTDLALAAYNAGPTAVEEAGGAPSGSVLVYVANVTASWRSLAGCR